MRPIILGEANVIDPNTTGLSVIGNGNRISGQYSKSVFINCHETDLSNENGENDNKTVFNDGAMVIDEDGNTTGLFAYNRGTITGNTTIDADVPFTAYFVDATGGNIVITIAHTTVLRVFIRVDGSVNTVTLNPSSGVLSGGANTMLQYNTFIIFSNGTDMFRTGV